MEIMELYCVFTSNWRKCLDISGSYVERQCSRASSDTVVFKVGATVGSTNRPNPNQNSNLYPNLSPKPSPSFTPTLKQTSTFFVGWLNLIPAVIGQRWGVSLGGLFPTQINWGHRKVQ